MKQAMRLAAAGLVLMSGMAMAQTSPTVKDDLFAGTEKFAKGATDITELTMDPDSLQMVGGRNATRAHRMVLNVVRTYGYDKPGMYNMADVEEFRNKLNTGDWHCSVHTRDLKRGESTDICNKRRTDGMVETAIITVEPKELTFIHTIKQASADGGPGGMSSLSGTFGDPASRAEMMIMQAQLRAEMAAMGPQMRAEMAAMGPRMKAQMDALGAMHIDMPSLHLNLQPMVNWSEGDREMQKQRLQKRMAPAGKPGAAPQAAPVPDTQPAPAAPVAPVAPSTQP